MNPLEAYERIRGELSVDCDTHITDSTRDVSTEYISLC